MLITELSLPAGCRYVEDRARPGENISPPSAVTIVHSLREALVCARVSARLESARERGWDRRGKVCNE